MAGAAQALEKLQVYLQALTPEARALLMAELERSLLRGDALPQAHLLLQHLRSMLGDSDPAPERVGNPSRLFFMPVEPFIVDDAPEHVHDGRLSRACLEPIWDWLEADLAPAEAKAYTAEVSRFLLAKEQGKADQAVRAFQDVAIARIENALATISRDEKVRRQLSFRLGTPRAQADVLEFVTLLKARDALAVLGARLPNRIRNLAGEQLDTVHALLESVLLRQKDLFRYALVLVMSRLPTSWHLLRIAVRAAQTEAAERVAETPYATAVRIVLADIERVVRHLNRDFKAGQIDRAAVELKDVHDALRGVRGEIVFSNGSLWARQLAAIRASIADSFKSEIEMLPGRVRRIIRVAPAKQMLRPAIDPSEVTEIEGMLVFLAACKNYASELALNEITMRVHSDLQNYLENGSRALVESLRSAVGSERAYRQMQIDAAVRFCAKMFSDEYAALLARAAEVAASERKAAAKA